MLLTVRDVQRETSCPRSSVYKWISTGELPAVRFGRAIRVRRVDLERFIEDRLQGARNDR